MVLDGLGQELFDLIKDPIARSVFWEGCQNWGEDITLKPRRRRGRKPHELQKTDVMCVCVCYLFLARLTIACWIEVVLGFWFQSVRALLFFL